MHDHHPASSPLSRYDVVIAGAGPVGLFLARELRLADLSVLVLEQAKDPSSSVKRIPFGMRGLSVPTIEAFYRRGLLNDLAASQPLKQDSGSIALRLSHIGCSSNAARADILPWGWITGPSASSPR